MAVKSVMPISMVVASELALVGSPDSQCFTSRGISVPLSPAFSNHAFA